MGGTDSGILPENVSVASGMGVERSLITPLWYVLPVQHSGVRQALNRTYKQEKRERTYMGWWYVVLYVGWTRRDGHVLSTGMC
jgi:hypothetical protein